MVTKKSSKSAAGKSKAISATKKGTGVSVAVIRSYRLSGQQVEPEASYWNRCPTPCPLSLDDLTLATDSEFLSDGVTPNPRYFPAFPTNPTVIRDEFQELLDLQTRRNDPTQVTSTTPGRERLPVSTFLQLRPPPLGTTVNTARGNAFPVILTGSELARFFESETPGLPHRRALDILIRDTNWSPPRQAFVWAAFDVTIHSALMAAWYYKWLSPRPNVSRRQRPIEYAIDNGYADKDENDADDDFTVLFDRAVNSTGSGNTNHRPNFPVVTNFIHSSPGTPRHPAYPSGHSVSGGAGSELLSFFFPDYRREFDFLADNTGMARLWAGIHWRSDHVAGTNLGRTVACLIIEQLRRSGIPFVPAQRPATETPPPIAQLQTQADALAANCGHSPLAAAPDLRRPVSEPCVTPGDLGEDTSTDPADTRGVSFVG